METPDLKKKVRPHSENLTTTSNWLHNLKMNMIQDTISTLN